MSPSDEEIDAMLLALAEERGPGATFCPSEAARRLSEDWRPLMPAVRARGALLQAGGRLRCTQKGVDVDPLEARGPIRFAASG